MYCRACRVGLSGLLCGGVVELGWLSVRELLVPFDFDDWVDF